MGTLPTKTCSRLALSAAGHELSYNPHRKSLISTTSRLALPREMARRLPSRETAKLGIRSDVNLVICFGGPPSIGWLQRLPTPLCHDLKVRERPSGLQKIPDPKLKCEGGVISFGASLEPAILEPSSGIIAICHTVPPGINCSAAIYFPSGEKAPRRVGTFVTCTASPPSLGTFQSN